ncbi:unnamed protein product [Parascedosporium putredinis]|uniref:Uncharacterized protein n=1 Tax=Parascedosporium putredinis TaxID=1442378 RepID=A0A9P1HAT6_9PEZI|nr:unnamed protein product [Parascedosporium putredinis]CAI8001573.1 unnamed protein product [Parascedosporium putredinis]
MTNFGPTLEIPNDLGILLGSNKALFPPQAQKCVPMGLAGQAPNSTDPPANYQLQVQFASDAQPLGYSCQASLNGSEEGFMDLTAADMEAVSAWATAPCPNWSF